MGELFSRFCYCTYEEQLIGERVKAKSIVMWSPVGSNASTASNREKLAWLISSELPSLQLGEEASSLDQVDRWMKLKDLSIRIAMCLLSGRSQPDNPLLQDLEEGQIDQWYHDRTWLSAELYENLWKLISLKWKKIQACLKKAEAQNSDWSFPFKFPLELTIEALREDIDGEFLLCLKPRHDERLRPQMKFSILRRASLKGDLEAKERKYKTTLKEITKELSLYTEQITWWDRVEYVAQHLAQHDRFIKARLEIQDSLRDAILKMDRDSGLNPEFRHHVRNETWIDGERMEPSKALPKWNKRM